jgi:hypothetical protein
MCRPRAPEGCDHAGIGLKLSVKSLLPRHVTGADDSVPALAQTREWELYAPVKEFLEMCGYEVKGEVRGCDLVARRGDEPPVVVELKLRFSLSLVLQGVDRLALTERVYLAVPRTGPRRRRSRGLAPDSSAVRKLCRRLGLGLILIGSGKQRVEVLEEPGPYQPRMAKERTARLLDEFARRAGDANVGGVAGVPLVTAYRQDALACARALTRCGPMRLAALRSAAGVPRAARIVQRNLYGWFARPQRGTYDLTEGGRDALARFADAVTALPAALPGASRPEHQP